jgi:hypothetical protein
MGRGRVIAEHPAHVGVGQAAQHPADARPVTVRGVGVTGPVGEGVMPAVSGDPGDDGPFEGHGARYGQRDPQRPGRAEPAVGEVTVISHGHAEPGDRVQHGHQQQVGHTDTVAPGQPDGHGQPGQRGHRDDAGHRHLHRAADGKAPGAGVGEGNRSVVNVGSARCGHEGSPRPELVCPAGTYQFRTWDGRPRLSRGRAPAVGGLTTVPHSVNHRARGGTRRTGQG